MADETHDRQNIQADHNSIAIGSIHVEGSIGGDLIIDNSGRAAGTRLPSLHQLPHPPADFTGQEDLISRLLEDFTTHQYAAITAKPIYGLTGMGGIGKTALGLVVAQKIADNYPDAQIFLDLKGTTMPLTAVDIMRHVILSFEPTADLGTKDEIGIANTYRSVLYGKRALLFLDNARSAEQITPLNPPETCAILITSRWVFPVPGLQNRPMELMSKDVAEKFLLDICPSIKDQASDLAKTCAYLPLALRVAGSFLQVNENWEVEKYILQLNNRKHRLSTLHQSLEESELKTEPDLLATFELSYSQLSEKDQKRWRMLGIFPASFDLHAAQSMWCLEDDKAIKLLGLLRRYSLLDYDKKSSRYKMHDLLADYACLQMGDEEEQNASTRHAAHYKDILIAADKLYVQGGEKILLGLNQFDLEWENIRAGQLWVAARNRNDASITNLCLAYLIAGVNILSFRQHPMERIQLLSVALSLAREINDRRSEGIVLVNLGNTNRNLGNARKAIEFSAQALIIAQEYNDRQGEGLALGSLGNAYAELGDLNKAIAYFEQRLVIAREIDDRRGEANVLGNLGNAYAKLEQVSKAIEFHKQHLVIAREIGDRRGESSALGSLGTAYYFLEEVGKAIEFNKQALIIAREIHDRPSEGIILGNLGLAYANLGETDKAIDCYEQALVIAHETGNRRSEESALGYLGFAYADLGETRKAIEYYEQALEIDKEIGDLQSEVIDLVSLGNAYRSLGDAHKAIEYYEQCLVLARELGDRQSEAKILAKLGNIYMNLEEARDAIEYYEQCLVIARELDDRQREANILGNLGNAYCILKELRKAIKYYEQQLSITQQLEDCQGEGNASFNMALALHELDEKDRAIDLAQRALALFEAIGSPTAEIARNTLEEWGVLPMGDAS